MRKEGHCDHCGKKVHPTMEKPYRLCDHCAAWLCYECWQVTCGTHKSELGFEACSKVLDALRGLPAEAQARVLEAARIITGKEETP